MGSGNSSLNESKPNITADDEMLRIIECPVCQGIPFPPIFMCSTGHNICKNCRPKLNECPTCKEVFTDKRNYTVEALVQTSKHICPHNSSGCDLVTTGDLMEGHLNTCQYKPQPCPFMPHLDCTESSLQLPVYKDHLVSRHMIAMSSGDTLTLNYKVDHESLDKSTKVFNACWSNLLDFDGNTFFINMFPDPATQMVYWAVLLLGVDKEAEKYGAQITLTTDKTRRIQLTWRFPVYSILKQHAETEANSIFQPSCSFLAFRKFITPINDDKSDDKGKLVVSAKYVIHKFKS